MYYRTEFSRGWWCARSPLPLRRNLMLGSRQSSTKNSTATFSIEYSISVMVIVADHSNRASPSQVKMKTQVEFVMLVQILSSIKSTPFDPVKIRHPSNLRACPTLLMQCRTRAVRTTLLTMCGIEHPTIRSLVNGKKCLKYCLKMKCLKVTCITEYIFARSATAIQERRYNTSHPHRALVYLYSVFPSVIVARTFL